jgi:transcriptional regulator with XRE-family HTH domain
MAEGIVGRAVGGLGDYLKEQRVGAALSLRELAEQSGVSNPYLSMVERGVRNPSAQVLQQIAKALHISAEQLYIRAGLLSVEEETQGSVELAVHNDPRLDETQKRALLELYSSYVDADASHAAHG